MAAVVAPAKLAHEHHRIAIVQIPGLAPRPEQAGVGLEHVAFTYAPLT